MIPAWARRRAANTPSPFDAALAAIGRLEPELSVLDDAALRARARGMRDPARRARLAAGIENELFAVVREVARRLLGLRAFDVQLWAALAMARGSLIEMHTGEGKTLAAVPAACKLAFDGRGVHVLTVNDYLARRDAAWMGPVYDFLGLRVGTIAEESSPGERRAAYACDVTYLTAKEAGFDFLRDALVLNAADRVQRALHVAIVDEADSILIDEARHPLVIAGRVDEETLDPIEVGEAVRGLTPGEDYEIDQEARNVSLTDRGLDRLEQRLGIPDLHGAEDPALLAEIRNALHATALLRRDVDYIVRGGRVELVDALTGRVAEDRLWPDGLQAAIEAKERVRLRPDGRTLGSITMQHFLGRYERLTGMTATAAHAAHELHDFYELDVTAIPTHRPCIRVDHPDLVFTHRAAKDAAVVSEIDGMHASGRPVLVGTASVAESEALANRLRERGIDCAVLNAKNDEAEAAIVADAGDVGAVTISTNMAGRGTDIRLGGAGERRRDEGVELGGLHVIGTNRHESRRIDDQLRGRAGRQGDPGSSRFFVSLEDELIARFGAENLVTHRVTPDRQAAPFDHPRVRREIDRAQRIVDGQNLDTRKTLFTYSALMEQQRRTIDLRRRSILEGEDADGGLSERSPRRYRELRERFGVEVAEETVRQVSLRVLDRCWSDHLARIAEIRGGIHFVRLSGQAPLDVFQRQIGDAFEVLIDRIEREIVEVFESLTITSNGVDWEAEGLAGPSSTWTYLISDDPFEANALANMAHNPAMATGGVILWPLLVVWGVWNRMRRRRSERRGSR